MLAEVGVLVEGGGGSSVGEWWWWGDANICTATEWLSICIWVERDYTEGWAEILRGFKKRANAQDTMTQGRPFKFTSGKENIWNVVTKMPFASCTNRVTSSWVLGGRGCIGCRVVRAAYSHCSLQGATLHQIAWTNQGINILALTPWQYPIMYVRLCALHTLN